jgi:pantetheine-phosphate adenylyltransferase
MVRAIFPGTFDPIHFGHINIAERAVRLFDELIIAVYDKPLKSLLFPPEERIALVNETFNGHSKIRVIGYSGLTVKLCQDIDAQVVVSSRY